MFFHLVQALHAQVCVGGPREGVSPTSGCAQRRAVQRCCLHGAPLGCSRQRWRMGWTHGCWSRCKSSARVCQHGFSHALTHAEVGFGQLSPCCEEKRSPLEPPLGPWEGALKGCPWSGAVDSLWRLCPVLLLVRTRLWLLTSTRRPVPSQQTCFCIKSRLLSVSLFQTPDFPFAKTVPEQRLSQDLIFSCLLSCC